MNSTNNSQNNKPSLNTPNVTTSIEKMSQKNHHSTSLMGREEGVPWIWVCGGALITILVMILALFGVILSGGAQALWPKSIYSLTAENQSQFLGIAFRMTSSPDAKGIDTQRMMIFSGNQDFATPEFVYIDPNQIKTALQNPDSWYIERLEWGPFIGTIYENSAGPNPTVEAIESDIAMGLQRLKNIHNLEAQGISPLNSKIEALRIERRGYARKKSQGIVISDSEIQKIDSELTTILARHAKISEQIQLLRQDDDKFKFSLRDSAGTVKTIPVSHIVRAFQPNKLGIFGRLKIFFSRLWEFVSGEPREANSAGGVFPALFGTVAMTFLMTLAVMPIGILTAVYIREIASQGMLVSLVRIAVGNLAGVPSIVYGVFGLGFFCYTIGTSIDKLFYEDKLPTATFGTGGILWASLTLAMLTVPVVIVSTEEALSSVPRTLREASYGCGATRLQTLLYIVLPRAMPGIMTGLILAMARGVGEVAPLLMTGVVKLAPSLPVDSVFPYVHLERSFMHLGFHIYDVGFQSRSTEATRPMVFASTSLLIAIVLTLNFAAIKIRSRLRKRFEGRGAF